MMVKRKFDVSVDVLGVIYGPTHDLRTGPNGPRFVRTRILRLLH